MLRSSHEVCPFGSFNSLRGHAIANSNEINSQYCFFHFNISSKYLEKG